MKTFLQELAEDIHKTHPRAEDVTIVFPNRRAALFFRKHYGKMLAKPVFSPKLLTIEDFFGSFSNLRVPDRLVLISILHEAYRKVMQSDSEHDTVGAFEDFYFWGDMLLRDFDEVDKYLVSATQVFKDLSTQKELDASFEFLTEEQRDFLRQFWSHFDVDHSLNKSRFLQIWRRLAPVYEAFQTALLEKKFAYEGMLYRLVIDELPSLAETVKGPVYFAGFNALTTAEEKLISYFVEHRDARVFWDVDEWYLNNEVQEAGQFFRDYQKHPVLGKTFPSDIPANFQKKVTSGKEVHLYGAAQPVGQAKLMAQVLGDELAGGMNPDETLIVLADEKLLMPVLHGVAGAVEKLNVTMGFPLGSTPMFNFVELLIELQIGCSGDMFNHRQVVALLGHPYVIAADAGLARSKRKDVIRFNWVSVPANYLATGVPLHRSIFTPLEEDTFGVSRSVLHWLQQVVETVGMLPVLSDLDKEYALHFLRYFNLLETVLISDARSGDSRNQVQVLKTFLRLFRQLMRNQKIPFSGEPLQGLQIMGVLETRNLDFKNVFVLSVNEGALPSTGGKGSYIPHNIRRAYGLPTLAYQDAMYAYLFYRMLQRAENIYLFYNTETDVLGQGEMSRYLQQLLFESGLRIRRHVLHNPVRPQGIRQLQVGKNADVIATLAQLGRKNERSNGFSPTALNSWLECRLQFYFRYVAHIKEADEVEEDLDARILGTFLHEVMEHFYKGILENKAGRIIEKTDLEGAEEAIDTLIDRAFVGQYSLDPNKPVAYAGQRLIVREVVRRFADRILAMDRAYAPFTIEGLEQEGINYTLPFDGDRKVTLSGKIDRVDLRDDVLRIIDYKTGKDALDFASLDSLFDRNGKRNKAAFQTLLYAWLYMRSAGRRLEGKVRVVPGLINRINVFDDDFSFGLRLGKHHVRDVTDMFPVFEEKLRELFVDMFDPKQPFDQTPHTETCRYCAYNRLCYR